MTGKEELKIILMNSRNAIRYANNKDLKAQKFADKIANLNKAHYSAFEAFSDMSGELADEMDSFPQVLDKQTFLTGYALTPASIQTLKHSNAEYFIEDGLKDGNVKAVPYTYRSALSRINRYLDYLNA